MITGYFMCTSSISMKKFLKLLLEILFYNIVITCIFIVEGRELVTLKRLILLISPVWNVETNFVSCFIIFFLTIPFWNILIRNMTERQHQLLLLLLLSVYTFLGSTLAFHITFNYVSWFGIMYLIASYIRLYPKKVFNNIKICGIFTIASIVISIISVFGLRYVYGSPSWCMVSDSNKFLAVSTAVSSFLLFKNINIAYNKWINLVGGSTFAVLLIHSNSDTMRKWLFLEVMNCSGIFDRPFAVMIITCILELIAVFVICIAIDKLRIILFENPFFKWYDKRPRFQNLTQFMDK